MTESPLKRAFRSPVIWPVLGLVVLLGANLIHSSDFLSLRLVDGYLYGNAIDIVKDGSRVMVLALGMTLVIAIGGIDLSVGSVMAISGAVAATVLGHGEGSIALALGAALLAGAVAGAVNGALIAYLGVQPIVATLATMYIGRGVARSIAHNEVMLFDSPGFSFLGKGYLAGLPFAALLTFALFLAVHFFLRKSALGLFVEAIGDNPIASRFAGLATRRVKFLTYVACGVCAALAGAMLASNMSQADVFRAGEYLELDAIFAVVVGGTALTGGRFLLLGSLTGTLLLQTLTITLWSMGVRSEVASVPKAILIIAVCVLQSDRSRRWLRGLFPAKGSA